MGFGTARGKAVPRVPLRHGEGNKGHLTSFGGLAALSLDALSSVAYGPEAVVLVLAAAGTAALRLALPVTLAIVGLLVRAGVLPPGHRRHPVAGGACRRAAGLIVITAVNLWGIAESARVLMLPMVVFLAAIFGVIVIGLVRSHPTAIVGTTQPVRVSEAVGVILILKAFAAGCSALTGIEAIANGVPVFREPRARRAQRTELMLGALLGAMLIGLAVLIRGAALRRARYAASRPVPPAVLRDELAGQPAGGHLTSRPGRLAPSARISPVSGARNSSAGWSAGDRWCFAARWPGGRSAAGWPRRRWRSARWRG